MGDGVDIAARLEGIAHPRRGVFVWDAYRQVRGRLTYGFVDLGEKMLKNISRPCGVYAIQARLRKRGPCAVGLRVECAWSAALSRSWFYPSPTKCGDPEQEYFVDGITESLTTDLSRISGPFVIGRNTAFTYKGKPIDLKRIGRRIERSLRSRGQRSARP